MNLQKKLRGLFQLTDSLLLPDETILYEISKKQEELKEWNEEIVLQGLNRSTKKEQHLPTHPMVPV